jgi:hypothetical protein
VRFPERLAHPDHLPLVLSVDPPPPPKAETLITETEAKQLRMLATCAGLAAELKGHLVEQYRIEVEENICAKDLADIREWLEERAAMKKH